MKLISKLLAVLLALLLLDSCTLFIPSQGLKIKSENSNSTLEFNGASIEPGKVKIKRRWSYVVTEKRYGYRSNGQLAAPNTLNPNFLGSLAFFGGIYAFQGNSNMIDIGSAAVYVAIDFLGGLPHKKHKRNFVMNELVPIPKSPFNDVVIISHSNMDSVSFEKFVEIKYKRPKDFISENKGLEENSPLKELAYKEGETFNLSSTLDGYLDLMNFQEDQHTLISPYDRYFVMDCEIEKAVLHELPLNKRTGEYCQKVKMDFKWHLCDNSGNRIYTANISGKSTEFYSSSRLDISGAAFSDAIIDSYMKLMSDVGFMQAIETVEAKLVNDRKSLEVIQISKPKMASSSMDEIGNAQVTVISGNNYHGSGCAISNEGYIITSIKVVDQMDTVEIKFSNGAIKRALVVRKDPLSNLALLKADTTGIQSLSIAEGLIPFVGDDVFAIGSPVNRNLSQSITKGIISGERIQNGINYLQTDAEVSRGDNGSPLLNANGKLIGIVNEKYMGKSLEGLSFAVPANIIAERLKIAYK